MFLLNEEITYSADDVNGDLQYKMFLLNIFGENDDTDEDIFTIQNVSIKSWIRTIYIWT